jgi:hypothetical protein
MSEHGQAPGSDAIDEMINGVDCQHLQLTLRSLLRLSSPQHAQFDHVHSVLVELSMMLKDTKVELISTKSELMSTKFELQQLRSTIANPPVYPQFVNAAGSMSSASPIACSSSSEGVSDQSGDSSENAKLGLKCIFCTHVHFKEKSHTQHLDRLLKRVNSGELYSGHCAVPSDHWLFRSFGGSPQDAISTFIKTYVSFLASSNDRNIDPVRASKLHAWIQSLQPSLDS